MTVRELLSALIDSGAGMDEQVLVRSADGDVRVTGLFAYEGDENLKPIVRIYVASR
jgi:hypothetical protein